MQVQVSKPAIIGKQEIKSILIIVVSIQARKALAYSTTVLGLNKKPQVQPAAKMIKDTYLSSGNRRVNRNSLVIKSTHTYAGKTVAISFVTHNGKIISYGQHGFIMLNEIASPHASTSFTIVHSAQREGLQ